MRPSEIAVIEDRYHEAATALRCQAARTRDVYESVRRFVADGSVVFRPTPSPDHWVLVQASADPLNYFSSTTPCPEDGEPRNTEIGEQIRRAEEDLSAAAERERTCAEHLDAASRPFLGGHVGPTALRINGRLYVYGTDGRSIARPVEVVEVSS